MQSHRTSRRGVILLLVLSLMTMFALLVLTFMVVTSHSYRGAASGVKIGAVVDYQDKTVGALDTWAAITEVLLGSKNSAIRNHGLLENLYSHPVIDGVDLLEFKVADISAFVNLNGGAFPISDVISKIVSKDILPDFAPKDAVNAALTKQLIGLCLAPPKGNGLPAGYTSEELLDLMGNILTFSEGTLKGTSARIVHKKILRNTSAPSGDCFFVIIKPFDFIDIGGINNRLGTADGDICLINGAPFSGTGIGYDDSLASWEAALALDDGEGLPYVLRPNAKAPNTAGTNAYRDFLDKNHVRMNVDYTAPDTNNMFLAWYDLQWNDGNKKWEFGRIIPSFLRPSLMPYLDDVWNGSDDKQNMDMFRKMVLRPLPFDHPNFTGSNPYWDFRNVTTWDPDDSAWNPDVLTELRNLCGGYRRSTTLFATQLSPDESTFDVDNDGDGVKEGIWIDIGLPIRRSSSGQLYKPLVSYTIIDMDGRTNVNVQGNRQQVRQDSVGWGGRYYDAPVTNSGDIIKNDGNPIDPANPTDLVAMRGNGGGPAGVRLAYSLDAIYDVKRLDALNNSDPGSNFRLLGDSYDTGGELAAWRLMTGESGIVGRYGVIQNGGVVGNEAKPGQDTEKEDAPDLWMKLYDGRFDTSLHPDWKEPFLNVGGVKPDFWDTAALAYDAFGHRADAGLLDIVNNPYRFDPYNGMKFLSDEVPDMRFTPAELEGLLRQSDVDQAYLSERLNRLLWDDPSNNNSNKTLASNGRYFLTTESHDIPLPNPRFGVHSGIYSLLYHCVGDQVKQKLGLAYPLDPDVIVNVVLPLVDKLAAMLPEQIRNGEKLDINLLTQKESWVNPTDDPAVHLEGLRERADLARGIYILLMAMSYDQLYGANGAAPYFEPSLAQESRLTQGSELARQVMATRLAQYAVNLIDFADADATMTPMIFDVDPFAIVDDGAGGVNIAQSCWMPAPNGNPAGFETLIEPAYPDSSFHNASWTNTELMNYLSTPLGDIRGTGMCRVRLIRGLERSDVVLTETMATHDLGVADTAKDDGVKKTTGGTPPPDPNFDQVKIPEASAWFELYCTADANQPVQPNDLFSPGASPNTWVLDLGRMAPPDATGLEYPVWHLAISESTEPDTSSGSYSKQENSIAFRLADPANGQPITFSLQTQQPELTGFTLSPNFYGSILGPTDTGGVNDVAIDRIVWFAQDPRNPAAGAYPPSLIDQVYWGRGSGLNFSPKDYLVIAPRMTTYLGSLAKTATTPPGEYGHPSGEGIDLSSTGNVIVAAAAPPSGWNVADWEKTANLGIGNNPNELGIGINISAPLPSSGDYYDEPKFHTSYPDLVNILNMYGDGTGDTYPDTPFDLDNSKADRPLVQDNLYGVGTVPMIRSVMLQRLADPNLPYDPIFNPYVTVDWSMIDLTIFSGESDEVDPRYHNGINFANKDTAASVDMPLGVTPSGATQDCRLRLSSRQWGRTAMPSALSDAGPNPWARVLDPAWVVDGNTSVLDSRQLDPSLLIDGVSPSLGGFSTKLTNVGEMNFPHRPQHTFGKLNWMYNNSTVSTIVPVDDSFPNLTDNYIPLSVWRGGSLGKIVLPDHQTGTKGAPILTDGTTSTYCPFINLAWNNSPYSNPYEAMSVPASAPGRFGLEFVDRNNVNIFNGDAPGDIPENDPLVGSLGSGGRFGYSLVGASAPGQGHLLNFFHSSLNVDNTGASPVPKNNSMNLGAFLDHIQVPSRFFGTKEWLDPTPGSPYSVPTYREPGKINVNTMTGPTFAALMNDRALPDIPSNPTARYDRFREQRDGDLPAPPASSPPPPSPYRSLASNRLVPPDPNGLPFPVPADATLLRYYDDNTAGGSPNWVPLLTLPEQDDPSNPPARNPTRTITEELEGLQRLSNMTTTRSNVFAVWVTVGYFEAEPVDFVQKEADTGRPRAQLELIYPDGHEYGKELGYGAGNEQTYRHRSFYLIDRTIPVGFRRGDKTLNFENVILLKKSIE
ncbi:MAG: hypothetical protein FWC43_01070 [Planctomycetaceae bacterium]|nr:hypothetical protein [Planctomycetaceae bacterium]